MLIIDIQIVIIVCLCSLQGMAVQASANIETPVETTKAPNAAGAAKAAKDREVTAIIALTQL